MNISVQGDSKRKRKKPGCWATQLHTQRKMLFLHWEGGCSWFCSKLLGEPRKRTSWGPQRSHLPVIRNSLWTGSQDYVRSQISGWTWLLEESQSMKSLRTPCSFLHSAHQNSQSRMYVFMIVAQRPTNHQNRRLPGGGASLNTHTFALALHGDFSPILWHEIANTWNIVSSVSVLIMNMMFKCLLKSKCGRDYHKFNVFTLSF